MAATDYFKLAQEIAGRQAESFQPSPWTSTGANIQMVGQQLPATDWKKMLASALVQGVGGAIGEYGRGREEEQRRQQLQQQVGALTGGATDFRMTGDPQLDLARALQFGESRQEREQQRQADLTKQAEALSKQYGTFIDPYSRQALEIGGLGEVAGQATNIQAQRERALAEAKARGAGIGTEPFKMAEFEREQAGKERLESIKGAQRNRDLQMQQAFQKDMTKLKQDVTTSKDKRDLELKLNDRIFKSDQVKKFSDIAANYNTVERLVSKQNATPGGIGTGADDIAIIASLARVWDPGSTVREGELKIAESAQAPLSAYMKSIERVVLGGGKLTPQVRQEMLEAAKVKANTFKEDVDRYIGQIKTQSDAYGLNWGNIYNKDIFRVGGGEKAVSIPKVATTTFAPVTIGGTQYKSREAMQKRLDEIRARRQQQTR